MPTLSSRLISRSGAIQVSESNLEAGQIFVFTSGTETTDDGWFCWRSPGTGTAKIEIWGAGGSGAQMCCCGGGLPGNPGAYSLRTITVNGSSYICGCYGRSCGNSSALCDRGTSQPTTICWVGSAANGCMCSQGGRGGISIFASGASLYCCFVANGFCGTNTNTNCGVVCNIGTAAVIANCCCAQAYGGTVNCFGGFSCASFFGCTPNCICFLQYHVAVPPGIFGTAGAQITFNVENGNGRENWSGAGPLNFNYALAAGSTSPGMAPFTACWVSNATCGCYENHGCGVWYPYGVPGLPPHPCTSVRDHATRGGHGAVRITFV